MKHLLLVLVLAIVLFYVGACAALYFYQRNLIYYPPSLPGLPAGLTKITIDGAELNLTTRPLPGPKALLYFGGNAEDVSWNLPGMSDAFPDNAVYLVHYRGYGGSAGQPSESAFHADALALFDRIHAEHPEITVVGRSLGSGVAVRLASERPARRLVLVTPYDSLQEIAAAQFPYFPVTWLLRDKFESWRYAPRVTAPTLLLLAEHDRVVPRDSSERLLTRFANGVAGFKILPGTDHNSISGSPAYYVSMR